MRSSVWRSVAQSPWASSRATMPYRASRSWARASSRSSDDNRSSSPSALQRPTTGRRGSTPRARPRRAPALARGALEHRPDHLAREPQAIEPFALVVLDARRQEVLLPDAHREIFALQQLERGEDAGRAGQTVFGMEMMATKQERRELLGRRGGAHDTAGGLPSAPGLLEPPVVD